MNPSFPTDFSKFNKGYGCNYAYATVFEISFVFLVFFLTIMDHNVHLLQRLSLEM